MTGRCANIKQRAKVAERCEFPATGYIYNEDAERLVGTGYCETCGRATVAEYLDKLGWRWSYRVSEPERSALPE